MVLVLDGEMVECIYKHVENETRMTVITKVYNADIEMKLQIDDSVYHCDIVNGEKIVKALQSREICFQNVSKIILECQ